MAAMQDVGIDARQGQRERRRLRARPPDRRVRRAHPRHADPRDGARGVKRGIAALCIGGGEATRSRSRSAELFAPLPLPA